MNFRERPDLPGQVPRTLSHGARVIVIERNKRCSTIADKTGRWVKVDVIDGQFSKEGWVWDSYIEYSTNQQLHPLRK